LQNVGAFICPFRMNPTKIVWIFSIFFIFAQAKAQTPIQNWTYKQPNHIQSAKIQPPSGHFEVISLTFSGKNAALLPAFKSPKDKRGAYHHPLYINKIPFTGELEGVNEKGGLEFQALFLNGQRYGDFLIVSEKGDTQTFVIKNHTFREVELNAINAQRIAELKTLEEQKAVIAAEKAKITAENQARTANQAKKPVIYLYPAAPAEVTIRVKTGKNTLTHTHPKYNPATGWQVVAQPNGDLVDVHTKKEYYALFWEAENAEPFKFDEGFSVNGAQTADFLDAKLAELGLNRREANEFIMYWLPRMENNAYNTIHFAAESYTNAYPLEISPRPDALIRVFMVFQPTNEPVTLPAQTFETPKRKGFTVVEWGGSEQASVNP
jgi:hypothetical protein